MEGRLTTGISLRLLLSATTVLPPRHPRQEEDTDTADARVVAPAAIAAAGAAAVITVELRRAK